MPQDETIRPFRVDFPDEAVADLRRRIAATRWPDQETVTDDSQGVRLALLQDLARYWGTKHDWRTCEARLNASTNCSSTSSPPPGPEERSHDRTADRQR